MAIHTTTNRDFPYPDLSEAADVPAYIQLLAEDLDDKVTVFSQGAFGSRPAAGAAGSFYLATETKVIYYDDGSQWNAIGVPTFHGFVAVDPVVSNADVSVNKEFRTIAQGTYDVVVCARTSETTGTPNPGVTVKLWYYDETDILVSDDYIFALDARPDYLQHRVEGLPGGVQFGIQVTGSGSGSWSVTLKDVEYWMTRVS